MSTRLVILGLLRKKPLYGYEIKHIIQDHMGDWTSIAFGSIYFALNKMVQENFIEQIATEKSGSRPSRSVYQITESGQQEFLRLLRETWDDVERNYFSLDIGLFFISALPPEEVIGYLRKRINTIQETLQYLDSHQTEQLQNEHVPPIASVIFEHSRAHMDAELSWTEDTLMKYEQGKIM